MNRAQRIILQIDELARDELISKKNINLQVEYNALNKKLYNNKLPKIKLVWSMSKTEGGKVRGRGVKNDPSTWKVQSLEISLFIESSYEVFLGLLAHEMIHVYIMANGITEYGGQHGMKFLAERARIQKLVDFDIPIKDDITHRKLSKSVKAQKVGVALFKNQQAIQIYTVNSILDVIKIYQGFPDEWKQKYDIEFIYSEDRELAKYPIKHGYKRGRKISTYPIEKDFFDRLKKEGKYIDKL